MRTRFLLFVLLLIPNLSYGQTRQFAWEQEATSAEAATSFIYKYYLDGRVTGTAIVGTKCSGSASPFTCVSSSPAFTPGTHSIVLTASTEGLESEKSIALTFTVAIMSPPKNVRFK